MMAIDRTNDISVPFEETLGDYTIYIDENPDRWTGGYFWSVCHNDEEVVSGLDFCILVSRMNAHQIFKNKKT